MKKQTIGGDRLPVSRFAMLKLEQFREICDNDQDRPNMLIQAYRVDSRRPGLPDGIPLRPIFVGIVQFTRDIYKERSESQLKTAASDLLMDHSPLVYHIAFGPSTWLAELISIDDDVLGPPNIEDAAEGFRIWLPR